jgi:TnpA family transposase
MATQIMPDAELEKLRRFPEISWEEVVRYFTLTPADEGFLAGHRRPGNVLGLAVQLCKLPWLGFVPDDVSSAPPQAVARLAEHLGIPAEAVASYGEREHTRTDHLVEVVRFLHWRQLGDLERKELGHFLAARAMEHDSPSVLFRLACEYLRTSRVVRPGPDWLSRQVAAAREQARAETYQRVEPLIAARPSLAAELDNLLVVEADLGSTRLHWLTTGAHRATPAAVKAELAKLAFLRGMGADELQLGALPAEGRRHLAAIGRRSTAQALARSGPERRHPVLLALLAQCAVDVLDEVVQLYDQAVSSTDHRAERKVEEQLAARAKASEDRLGLLDELLVVLTDPEVPDEAVGTRLRGGIGMERLRAAKEAGPRRLPRDHGHLQVVEASYSHLREFAPAVLAAVHFEGASAAQPLLRAVEVLKELNASGARKVPEDAPDEFVPARWRGYLSQASASGDHSAYRHYWELCVLLALRDGLRCGDVFVPGSRRYADPASYLLTPEQWEPQRTEFCTLVERSPDPARAWASTEAELEQVLGDLDAVLASGYGHVRLSEQGELVISPLSAESVPAEADDLRDELTALLPRPRLASLLIEMDHRIGFSQALAHSGGKSARSPELARNLYACLVAQATNLGLVGMAEASGIAYDVLAWTSEWYLGEDSLRAANATIVNYHHSLSLSSVWGGGTLSSSDGQRFPTKGKSLTARALSRYFVDEGISTYTHVSDQLSTYGTKVIVATQPEAPYVLDEILGNQTDLPIAEHATDTAGASLVNFALFDLVGKQFSPRIRDLGKITLYRTGPKAELTWLYPYAGPLLTRRANKALVSQHWDDLLRMAASLKFGHATASLVVGKLSASGPQNTLAAALKEYGALRRTIYAARYLSDEAYRRKIARQLNKGESLHALRRDLCYAHEGAVRHRHHEDQTTQALCLTVVANAIVAWTTEYLGLSVAELRASGRRVDDDVLALISPAHNENVGFYCPLLKRPLSASPVAARHQSPRGERARRWLTSPVPGGPRYPTPMAS